MDNGTSNLDKNTLIRTLQESMTNELIDYCSQNKIDPLNPSNEQAKQMWCIVFEEELDCCNDCGDFFNTKQLFGAKYEKSYLVCENCNED
jgi:hypothetical protein